jgi:hypothetical protein
MATNVQEISSTNRISSRDGKYFRMHIKGWTDFDPTGKDLSEIAAAIERGDGLVTVVEVTQVANQLSEINDSEVRERFEDRAAVDRVISKINQLPKSLQEKLYSAMNKGR